MTSSCPSAFRRFCAAVVAAALVLQPLGAIAAPITTSPLAQVPVQGSSSVKPNIMYTMDDSGSMKLPTLPDYVYSNDSNLNPTYVLNGDGTIKPNIGGAISWCLGSGGAATTCQLSSPPFASSKFNRIYYDSPDPPITPINYIAGKRADGTDLPCEGSNTKCDGPWTAVYTDGFAGYPNANTSATTNLVNNFPDEVFCSKTDPTADEKNTAKNGGSVCRYNGKDYGSGPGYWYPNASFPYPVAFPGSPYYYRIASVKFCATPPDANGWGTGTCSPRWSPTNRYVSYGTGGFDPKAFVRVDIDPADKTQMANFAKWYAFSRTRILAMKTAGGLAFSELALANPTNTRVGFNTLNTYATKFLNVQDFKDSTDTGNAGKWFKNFYSVTPTGATPTLDAMWRIGEYFSNRGAAAGLPGAADPLDPKTGQCQLNYHLLSTDGYWFQQDPFPGYTDRIKNWDLTVKALPGPIDGFTLGGDLPRPYREGSDAAVNSVMSDYAMYYWLNDIRTDKPNKVGDWEKTSTTVMSSDLHPPWQHVTFYGLSIGAKGTLIPAGDEDAALLGSDDAALLAGSKQWPKPVIAGNVNAGPAGIDDMWHAAVNSRGKYINVQNARELGQGMVSALADFTDQLGTGTAVGLAGAQLSSSGAYGYKTSYELEWWGDVKKYELEPLTGTLKVGAGGVPIPLWSAAERLDAQAAGEGWKNRRIVTINDSTNKAEPFWLGKLSSNQVKSFTDAWKTVATPPTEEQVLNFLRGDTTNEGTDTNQFRKRPTYDYVDPITKTKTKRTHILGDIVYSGAVPVGSPWDTSVSPPRPVRPYSDPGYAAFAEAKKDRTPTVYVGANDGMLHAFDNSPCIPKNAEDAICSAGKETWAFIPKALFTAGDPNDTSHTPSPKFQIAALSYRRGGIPSFQHKFYVNATPRIWDVDFANTAKQSGAPDWRTILVGGLGAGGRSVYALDVTKPVTTELEADIVDRVLWEFTDDDLGYVFDAPTLVKTKAYGWVALVASGYNNKGGKGYLYVLNPNSGGNKSGDLLAKIPLPGDTGTDESPTGLSTIRAFTPSRKDPYVLQAYGGDLKGNVWRFDLSDSNPSKWKAELIAKLTDPSGKPQPITTGVRVEIDQINNVDRYIFVGTGKLLHPDDLYDTSVTNTFYVIKDGTNTMPDPPPAELLARKRILNSVDETSLTGFTGKAIGPGWYQDAKDPMDKIVTDVIADVQTVVAVFSKPSADPCAAALTSTLYAREFLSGNSVIKSSGGAVAASITDIGAIAGVTLIQGQAPGGGLTGDVRIQVTTMKGQVVSFGVQLTGGSPLRHRVSWRLIKRD